MAEYIIPSWKNWGKRLLGRENKERKLFQSGSCKEKEWRKEPFVYVCLAVVIM